MPRNVLLGENFETKEENQLENHLKNSFETCESQVLPSQVKVIRNDREFFNQHNSFF